MLQNYVPRAKAIRRSAISLVPRPRPSTRERGSGNFSWHFVRFKSCDTCLCACAFQQQARDPRTVSCPGGGVWVAVTREFERDNCVISEILQSDWTIPNRAGVPRKSTRPSFVRESREGLGPRLLGNKRGKNLPLCKLDRTHCARTFGINETQENNEKVASDAIDWCNLPETGEIHIAYAALG